MEKEQKDALNHLEEVEQQHSMVCNDQLFYQELRIAAEEAERDHSEELSKKTT